MSDIFINADIIVAIYNGIVIVAVVMIVVVDVSRYCCCWGLIAIIILVTVIILFIISLLLLWCRTAAALPGSRAKRPWLWLSCTLMLEIPWLPSKCSVS